MKNHVLIRCSLFSAWLMATALINAAAAEMNEREKAQSPAGAPGPGIQRVNVVNAYCPVSGGPLDANGVLAGRTRGYKGRTVGFCCDNCPKKWDRMTEQEKEKNFVEAMNPGAP